MPDPDRRPTDLIFFIFRSIVTAVIIDIRPPASSLSLAFFLHLHQSLSTYASSSDVVIKPSLAPVLVTAPPNLS